MPCMSCPWLRRGRAPRPADPAPHGPPHAAGPVPTPRVGRCPRGPRAQGGRPRAPPEERRRTAVGIPAHPLPPFSFSPSFLFPLSRGCRREGAVPMPAGGSGGPSSAGCPRRQAAAPLRRDAALARDNDKERRGAEPPPRAPSLARLPARRRSPAPAVGPPR